MNKIMKVLLEYLSHPSVDGSIERNRLRKELIELCNKEKKITDILGFRGNGK